MRVLIFEIFGRFVLECTVIARFIAHTSKICPNKFVPQRQNCALLMSYSILRQI